MAAKITTTRDTALPWARCQALGCPWKNGESDRSGDLAKHHARAAGHQVLVVTEDRTVYKAAS